MSDIKELKRIIKQWKSTHLRVTGLNKKQLQQLIIKYNMSNTTETKVNYDNLSNAEFIKHIKDRFRTKLTETEFKSDIKNYYDILRKRYPNNRSLSVKLSEIRKVIKANQDPELYKLSTYDIYFNLPRDDRNKIKSDYKKSVEKKNMEQLNIKYKSIKSLIKELKTSNKLYDKVILLLIASGIRPIEIFISKFKRKTKYKLQIEDLAKKRGKKSKVIKPLNFMTSDEFITMLNDVKKNIASVENKDPIKNNILNKNIHYKINRKIIELFDIPLTQNKSSFLRKLYSVISYKHYNKRKNINFNLYLKTVLGHDDLLTSFSYSTINLV